MRVGIIQSSYIPWRGSFDFISSVDLFVIYDDILYSGGSWRNRNQLKTAQGLRWITIPVQAGASSLTIDQVKIGQAVGKKPWQHMHRQLLTESLSNAPYFSDAIELWESAIVHQDCYLSCLNIRLIQLVCNYLNISTPIVMSRDYGVTGQKTERLINLLKKLEATVYVSGPTAKGYLSEEMFQESGIGLEYKSYSYDAYPQAWGDFVGTVTILDLIANVGHDAYRYLSSKTPNKIAIPTQLVSYG